MSEAKVIFGVGITVLDHVAQLESFPAEDSKGRVASHFKQAGGPVPTALATAVFYGSQAFLLSRWGNDDAGNFLANRLASRGVDVSLCTVNADTSMQNWETGFAHIWINQNDNGRSTRTIASFPGLYPSPDAETILQANALQQMRTCGVLHLDGSWPDASLEAARQMRRIGGTVVLDAGSLKPGMEQLLPLVDVLIGSELFCLSKFGQRTVADAKWRKICSGVIFTTHAADGASMITSHESLSCPAESVLAVDTNGAGDIFSGAVLAGLSHGLPGETILRRATKIASHSCSQTGNEYLIATAES